MFISAFLLGNLDNTAECLVQQRQRRAQQHDEQQPGVSLGRAFGTRSLHGHRTGFICRLSGHIETCLLAQVFPCAISILNSCNSNMIKRKSQKHHPWSGRGHWTSGDTLGRDSWFSAFIFLIRMLRNVLLRLVHCECALRVGR